MTEFLRKQQENIIYLLIFALLFAAPILSLYIRSVNDDMPFHWDEVIDVWKILTVYVIIFAIHNFLLAPMLIYKNRKALYFTIVALLLSAFIVLQCTSRPDFKHPMAKEIHGPVPPEFRDDNIKQGEPGKHRPHHRPHGHRPPIVLGQADVISTVILVFMLGMNLGVKYYFRSERSRKRMEQLEHENLTHQLEYLKFQINPHFFMNTLNNIHALVDIDPEKAKNSIILLSKMMRYILYEGDKNTIPLQREVAFIENYIALMRMRYTDKVSINVDMPKGIVGAKDQGSERANEEWEIPPLLLITFVENAFKHGVSYRQESFIDLYIGIEDGQLIFRCRNSKAQEANQEKGGVGLTNVKKRLDLIYGTDYTLNIKDDDTYSVDLRINKNSTP